MGIGTSSCREARFPDWDEKDLTCPNLENPRAKISGHEQYLPNETRLRCFRHGALVPNACSWAVPISRVGFNIGLIKQ